MFVKLGAFALFASLAAALEVIVTQPTTVANGQIGVNVDVNPSDVGDYNFLLLGPAEDYNYELRGNVHLGSNEYFTFNIPPYTPNGRDYVIGLASTAHPETTVVRSNTFEVRPGV